MICGGSRSTTEIPMQPHIQALLLCSLLACPPAAAQAVIVPADRAGRFGNAPTSAPIGVQSGRTQLVIEQRGHAIPTPANLTAIELRGRGLRAVKALLVELELHVGAAPGVAAALSPTFASNLPAGTVRAIARTSITLPALPASAVPLPFLVRFPFTQPLPLTAPGDLLFDFRIHKVTFEPPAADYHLDGVTLDLGATSHGTGCKSSLGIRQILIPATGPGRVLNPLHGPAPKGLPALLFMGASLTSFHGVPLPFDLGQLGAPGCTLYNGPDIFLPFLTAGGYEAIRLPLPADPSLENAPLHAQVLYGDAAANPAGATATNGVSWTFRNQDPVSMVVNGFSVTSPEGILLPGQGPIARLTWSP
jgi:hypothetical protein